MSRRGRGTLFPRVFFESYPALPQRFTLGKGPIILSCLVNLDLVRRIPLIHACRGSTFWLFNRSVEAMPRSAVIAGVAAAAALAAGAAFVVAPARAPSPPTACQPELACQVLFKKKPRTYTSELVPQAHLRAKASCIWSQWICCAVWKLGPCRRRPTHHSEGTVNQNEVPSCSILTCEQR